MRKNLLCIPILAVFLVGLTVTRVNTNSMPVVSVDPPISFGVVGETVTINVTVTNVAELFCYQGNLTFDPAVLNCSSVEEGPFLGTAGDTWWMDPVIDNYNGWVFFGNTLFPFPADGASGNGTLAIVTFDVLAEGTSPLNFSETALNTVDEEGATQPIPHTAEGGVFTTAIDTTPPAWSNAGTNNTAVGQPTLFHVKWTDNVALSGFIFGTNNTGTWTNDTWTPMGGTADWSNVTKTLNSTVGIIVRWRVWANDTSNNWNDTGILSLTTTTPPPNVAVESVTPFPTEVYFRQLVNINVTVKNRGGFTENFTVTTYYDDTTIGSQNVTNLGPGENETLTFIWNTADAVKGTYVIKAEASVVPGETEVGDNTLTDGTVEIKITDANGDELVDIHDLAMLGKAYGAVSVDPHYDPLVDFDGDGKVNYEDLFLLACNWGYGE